MNDHRLGYAPAMHEDFRTPTEDDLDLGVAMFPCGTPVRIEREAAAHWNEYRRQMQRQRCMAVVGVDQMTQADKHGIADSGGNLAVAVDEKILAADAHAAQQERRIINEIARCLR